MKGRVPEKELGGILVQAKCAAKNIRAQRERLLQFQLQLQPTRPGEDDAPAEEVVSGLIRVYCEGLEAGARYLTSCLTMTAQNRVPPALPLDFVAISDEQLFVRLLALRLPRRPVNQAQAFARIEAAFYAVPLNLRYCLTRCIEHLGHPKCADTDDAEDDDDDEAFQVSPPDTDDEYLQGGGEFGLPDPVAAATEDLAKIALSNPGAADTEPSKDGSEIGLSSPVAAAAEDLAKMGLSAPDAAATDEPSQGDSKTDLPATDNGETRQATIIDMDQARTYLNHACTLADLALKHVDLAVTAISSCLDPAQVASISAFADRVAYTK